MDLNERLHKDWIGMAQPEGLVVTVAALKAAEANITSPVVELQAQLRELAGDGKVVVDLRAFLREILGWSDEFVVDGADIPDTLRVHLDGGEILAPTIALRSADDPNVFALAVMQVAANLKLDAATDDKRWTATPHQRFERLLRDTGVHVGVLTNGASFRLIYAPKGESAGWVTFQVADMLQVAGRELLGALHMLLNERRLLSLEESRRLSGILRASREYQNTVSNRLREQILSALRELLVGFQQADRLAGEGILRDYRGEHMQEVYGGIVTVLMRMVFVLFAEERGLLPIESELYASGYSLSRLHAQLADDRTRHGDTLNDRYGAWARIISLFRLLHDGVVAADGLKIPARKGDFFNPDKHPFLEGRRRGAVRQVDETLDLPRISDGVLFRVLDQLLVLEGERLQYKGLDVEQIGSVYEGLMGFEIEVAEGASLALMPEHVVVNLDALVAMPGADRIKQLKTDANLDAKDKLAGEVRAAKSVAELHAALARRVSSRQPGLIAKGSLYLQPGEERRKSGSHYTPKSLTGPIVETTLRPVLERLGADVTPAQILDLKVCDPAMGSAAFLVEACRQLADHLVAAWRRTGTMPELPPDEDPVLHARRLIAQRCLYGVDKNPLAADLARLSIWLVTFAKDHPFTFVDHALRCGDSLVGLSREQIASLTWAAPPADAQTSLIRSKIDPIVVKAEQARARALAQLTLVRSLVDGRLREVERLRREIHAAGDVNDDGVLVGMWREATDALAEVRLFGDAVISSFLSNDSEKARKSELDELSMKVQAWLGTGTYDAALRGMVADLREGKKGVAPFHWEVEFPEVFGRENPGFDCFVGNPPFAGKNTIFAGSGESYVYYLIDAYPGAHGSSDLVAYFFRRAFALCRRGGTLGLVATNTIRQGDTRTTGLAWICMHGGAIFHATRRVRWPGVAAVVVSVVCIMKGDAESCFLDGRRVDRITAFLFHQGGHQPPVPLEANTGRSFIGSYVLGAGFLFEDGNEKATPVSQMTELLAAHPENSQRIFPLQGGEQINTDPRLQAERFVINFADMSETEARRWPDLMDIVEAKVRPERMKLGENGDARRRKTNWWRWGQYSHALFAALSGKSRVLVNSQVSSHLAFAYQPTTIVFGHTLNVVADESADVFAVVQSRVHEAWARFFGSSLEERPRYTPSDCFETFPFPAIGKAEEVLESLGQRYYDHRAAVMLKNNEGLTKTYNRFHSPDGHSADIEQLRTLHAEMDRAVLDVYGWTDIMPTYDFREQLDESIRLTWDDDTRDEVLARLLELNRVRAEEEAQEVVANAPEVKVRGKKKLKGDAGPMLPGIG